MNILKIATFKLNLLDWSNVNNNYIVKYIVLKNIFNKMELTETQRTEIVIMVGYGDKTRKYGFVL